MTIDNLAREGGLELQWTLGPLWTLVSASMHADGYPLVYLQLQQAQGAEEADVRLDLAKCMLIDPLPEGADALSEHIEEVCDYLSTGRSEPPPSLSDLEPTPRRPSHLRELAEPRRKHRQASS